MDLPQPPQDQDLKNIIDKLAQFVARNGSEFEQMTKTKQKDNQKFSFLFGGDFFNYYQYKVTTEQGILKHRPRDTSSHAPPHHNNSMSQGPPPSQNIVPAYPPSGGQGYMNQYPYNNYGPGPNFDGDHNQYGQMESNYPPPYNMPPIPGESMHMPSEHTGTNFNSQNMPPASTYPPGESRYMPPGRAGEDAYFHSRGNNPEPPYNMPAPMMGPSSDMGHPNIPPYSHRKISESPSHLIGGNGNMMLGSGNNGVGMISPMATSHPPPGQIPPVQPPNIPAPPSDFLKPLDIIIQEQQQLQEQITQSESNLAAQQLVLDQQKDVQLKEALSVARGDTLRKDAEVLGLDVQQFDDLINPITESCTKDSISNGKHWIFTHAISPKNNNWITEYLLYKATSSVGIFTHKLHIIYLMNDVLHHCLRKNADVLKESLENVLAPMYCHAVTCSTSDQKLKLDKLLALWQNKMHLDSHLLGQLKCPEESSRLFEEELKTQFPLVVQTVANHLDVTFEGYKQQHNAFVQHATTQIQQLEHQKSQIEQQQKFDREKQSTGPPPPSGAPFMPYAGPPINHPFTGNGPPPQSPIQQGMDFNQPPPGFNPSHAPLPVVDFSKPPPGFVVEEKENLVPTVPYFELPAALMAPLIHISENKFKPIDPAKLRLPLPTPPTERLLAAVDNFYQPPSHERPRNCDGWEQLALFDYYKAKSYGIKEKEKLIDDGHVQLSRSPSPVLIEQVTDDDCKLSHKPARRYRSVSPEEGDSTPAFQNRERSPSPRPNKSYRSPSPTGHKRLSPRRSPRRSRSRSDSSSPPPAMFSRRARSVTPPSINTISDNILDENNKGHQMLRSMGWGGLGLGAKEQGISEPISSGEVRDSPTDKFRGLGAVTANNDPYEAFRKNKGQAFVNRMKQRAEERSGT